MLRWRPGWRLALWGQYGERVCVHILEERSTVHVWHLAATVVGVRCRLLFTGRLRCTCAQYSKTSGHKLRGGLEQYTTRLTRGGVKRLGPVWFASWRVVIIKSD